MYWVLYLQISYRSTYEMPGSEMLCSTSDCSEQKG